MNVRDSLEGRSAVVTGASGDIGRAIVFELVERGAAIAALGRSSDSLNMLAVEVESKGGEILVVACDVTDSEQVSAAAAEVRDRFGIADILINNAGGARFIATPVETGLGGWRNTLELNATAPFVLAQTFGPGMIERGCGAIVNVGSVSGLRHLPGMTAYSTAKAALFQQTKALAREWGPSGVRVNAVAPGYVATTSWDSFDKDTIVADAGLQIPLGRWASPLEVAEPVVFLASDRASYISGVTLLIDGGMVC